MSQFTDKAEQRIEEAKHAAKRRYVFYALTSKTHLEWLNYWIHKWEAKSAGNERFSPDWEAYLKRRMNFIGKLIKQH